MTADRPLPPLPPQHLPRISQALIVAVVALERLGDVASLEQIESILTRDPRRKDSA